MIGFDAHPVKDSFNVISPETTFRVSLRVAPQQDPHVAMDAMVDFFEKNAPFGAEVHVEPLEAGMGWAMNPDCEATQDALTSLKEAFGIDPVKQGEGGSTVHSRTAEDFPRRAGVGHRPGGPDFERAQPQRIRERVRVEEGRRCRGAAP